MVEFRRLAWITDTEPYICPASELAWHPVRAPYHLGEPLLRDIAGRVEGPI